MRVRRWTVPIVLGVLANPLCLYLAWQSGGYGHGDYSWAKILFPYSLLTTILSQEITFPAVILAFVQFPIYGIAVATAFGSPRRMGIALISVCVVVLALASIHTLAVWAAYKLVDGFG